MPRPLRQDYPGATHHIFVRGVDRSAVAIDDSDHERALLLLARAVSRYELVCHAWCLMPNHSHFLVTAQKGNVSRAMQWLSACTAQSFNRRHERVGHLYQGRFGSRLVNGDGYFLELGRYLALNPLRAGLCREPGDWPWSSYAATAGSQPAPAYLDTGVFLDLLGPCEAYVAWVGEGLDPTFLDEHGFPKAPPRPSLESLLAEDSDRAIAIAHHGHGYSQAAIARHLGVSASQICRRLATQG